MKVFVINLESAKDRMSFMTKQFDAAGVSFERFPAVVGKNLQKREIKSVTSPILQRLIFGRVLNKCEVGCALSHMAIWRKVVDEGMSFACIVEDDVTVFDNMAEQLVRIEKEINPDENKVCLISVGSDSRDEDPGIYPCYENTNMCGYVVTRKSAAFLLACMNPIVWPCDHWNVWRQFGLTTVVCLPRSLAHWNRSEFGSMNDAVKQGNRLISKVYRLLGMSVITFYKWLKLAKIRKMQNDKNLWS